MWLTVEHVTRLAYDGPINEAYTEIRLKPAHRDGQRCSSFALATEPRGVAVAEYRDRFGNTVHHFDVLEQHTTLAVTARSEVWTPDAVRRRRGGAVAARPLGPPPGEPLRAARWLDRRARRRGRRRDGPTLETAHALMTAVRGRMKYETRRDRTCARSPTRRSRRGTASARTSRTC